MGRCALMVVRVVVLVGLSSGCDEDFDPPTLITELRVLGISAEPADLAPGESTTIEALVVGAGDETIEYAWEWCPFTEGPNSGYACPDPETVGMPPELEPFLDLGDQPTALLFYPGNPDDMIALCEGLAAEAENLPDFVELPDCEDGVDLTVRMTVSAAGFERVAIKRVFVWFRTPDEPERNHNPEIGSVLAADTELEPAAAVTASLGGTLVWDVLVDADSVEAYVRRGDDSGESRQEEILFSWFSSAGEWAHAHTFSDAENFTLTEAGENELTIPDADVASIDVFVVVRDGRGGADWVTHAVTIQ